MYVILKLYIWGRGREGPGPDPVPRILARSLPHQGGESGFLSGPGQIDNPKLMVH